MRVKSLAGPRRSRLWNSHPVNGNYAFQKILATCFQWVHNTGIRCKPDKQGKDWVIITNMTEVARLLLGLRAAGWTEKEINDFVLYIESGEEQYKPRPRKEISE